MGSRGNAAIRKRAHRYIWALMEDFHGKCFYCRREVMPVRFIKREDRVAETPHWISYRKGDSVIRVRKASIDHFRRIADCGDSRYENLVLSCISCNGKKDSTERLPHNKVCKRCGGPKGKSHDRRRHCMNCALLFRDEYFLDCGVGIS